MTVVAVEDDNDAGATALVFVVLDVVGSGHSYMVVVAVAGDGVVEAAATCGDAGDAGYPGAGAGDGAGGWLAGSAAGDDGDGAGDDDIDGYGAAAGCCCCCCCCCWATAGGVAA